MEPELTPCRLCVELELYVRASQQPDASAAGLSEAGIRNRAHQREEKIQKAELALEKHRKVAHSGQTQTAAAAR